MCYTLENPDEQSGLQNTALCEPKEVRRGRNVTAVTVSRHSQATSSSGGSRGRGQKCSICFHEPQGCLAPKPLLDGSLLLSCVSARPAPASPPLTMPWHLLLRGQAECYRVVKHITLRSPEPPRGEGMLLPQPLTQRECRWVTRAEAPPQTHSDT